MASPRLSSFCCERNFDTDRNGSIHFIDLRHHVKLNDVILSYDILCLVSSVIGIGGAIYQLRLRLQRNYLPEVVPEVIDRQSRIIFWLAVADGLASLGILSRSFAFFIFLSQNLRFDDLFCAIASGWIQYFYICTYLWTLAFAVDTYLNAAEVNRGSMRFYHLVCWVVSLVICVGGLSALYFPGLSSCGNGSAARQVPHYLSSYVPMLCVMIVNPFLFCQSSRLICRDLSHRGSSADEQARIGREVMSKFFSVVLIFYVCWLPNVVNGVLQLGTVSSSRSDERPIVSVSIALWQMMAILNPIQGFLNCLVYSKIALWPGIVRQSHHRRQNSEPENRVSNRRENDRDRSSDSSEDQQEQERSESSPLLLFR